MSVEVSKIIRAYNAEHSRPQDKINITPIVEFHVACILTRLQEVPNIHTAKEYVNYQNQLFKVWKLGIVDEIDFISTRRGKVRVDSELLLHFIQETLHQVFDQAKPSRGGKPRKNNVIQQCQHHINELKRHAVKVDFIAALFRMTPEAFKKAISPSRTKPLSK